MTLESMVFDYFKACMSPHRDRRVIDSCLYWVRDAVQPIIEGMGYTWTDKTERILIDSCLNFSSSWQVSFLVFFMRRLQGYR